MVTFTQDWERDGYLVINGARTIDKYKELRDKQHHYSNDAIFFAFSQKQFDEQVQQHGLQDKKIYSFYGGMYGTKEGIDQYVAFMKSIEVSIKDECDPQEVYLYEWNNHECCISWDGDLEPARIIARIWGEETLNSIKRLNKCASLNPEE